MASSALRDELLATHHAGRIQRMLDLGRRARADRATPTEIDALARGDVFERRLALLPQHTLCVGGCPLPFTEDPARYLRNLAFSLVPLKP